MNPGSLKFSLLLVIVFLLFYLLKKENQRKWILFLGSAVVLYSFGWISLITCLVFSAFNFWFGKYAEKSGYDFTKLVWANAINIASLLLFRVVAKFSGNHEPVWGIENNVWEMISAVGIGFYPIQNIAYQIDLYKKRQKPAQDLIAFSLGNMFFSRLTSGPILKVDAIGKMLATLPQKPTEADLTVGIQRILMGLIKKLVIAERFSYYINMYFDNQMGKADTGYDVAVAGIMYTLQLYFDFSGYMDIAIGSARIFGIALPENFNMPLRSQSISEWWRRWHMTLINWFTQYIYYPVAYRFRQNKKMAPIIAIFVTFAVSALWHGFGWTFIIWGALHIVYLIIETLLKKQQLELKNFLKPKLYGWIFIPITYIQVIAANMFFRATDLNTALSMFGKFFTFENFFPKISFTEWLLHGVDWKMEQLLNVRLGFAFAILYLIFEPAFTRMVNNQKYNILKMVFLLLTLIIFGVFDGANKFLYMQF